MDGQPRLRQKKVFVNFKKIGSVIFVQAFSDKVCIDEAKLFMGEWAAAFGRQEIVHSGEFMGILLRPVNRLKFVTWIFGKSLTGKSLIIG